jgi:hypothetical protein
MWRGGTYVVASKPVSASNPQVSAPATYLILCDLAHFSGFRQSSRDVLHQVYTYTLPIPNHPINTPPHGHTYPTTPAKAIPEALQRKETKKKKSNDPHQHLTDRLESRVPKRRGEVYANENPNPNANPEPEGIQRLIPSQKVSIDSRCLL